MNPGSLATSQEVSDYLRIPVQTLYEWRTRGKGPKGRRIGRHLRYRWADVEDWINKQPTQ